MIKVTANLIERFFRGECTAPEAEAVLQHFKLHPEVEQHYLGKADWDEISASDIDPLPAPQQLRMYANIKRAISPQGKTNGMVSFWRIAACFFLLISVALTVLLSREKSTTSLFTATVSSEWQEINNPTNHTMVLFLNDGTRVELEAHSQLSFPVKDQLSKRDIRLTGKAGFEVAKDKNRPFTVYAGNVATTALGTHFIVTAYKEDDQISVKLIEGHVVINATNLFTQAMTKPVYLSPLQEYTHLKLAGTSTVTRFSQDQLPEGLAQHPIAPAEARLTDMIFDHEPVSKVFSLVEQAYGVKLTYPAADLKDHYFTGTFNVRQDSLGRVLFILSETNKLNITKTNSGYRIIKQR